MPELPEVETTRRGIAAWVIGHPISRVVVRDHRLRWPVAPELPQWLEGHQIRAVERRAKYLILRRAGGGDVLVHLGMSGRLCILPTPLAHGRHDHLEIHFAAGHLLRFTDPRRFGAVLIAADGAEQHPRLLSLGPEPLGDDFHAQYLRSQVQGRKVAIKQLLMDAGVVVGVGNIYANEAMFLAGVRPTTEAGRVGLARCARLVEGIRQSLTQAIAAGGTTFRDFVGGDGKPGYFAQSLAVYGRQGLPCIRCSRPLTEIRQGGRSTVYCARCQK